MRREDPQRQVLGIEIGDAWMHVVEVRRNGRSPQLVNHAAAARPADEGEIGGALVRLIESANMTSREAVVAVPLHRAFLRELTFETRERKVRQAAGIRLNVSEEHLVFNYVVQGKTAEGRHAVLMVATPREVIEAQRRMLAETGIGILSMVAAPLGLLAAYRMDETVPHRGLVLAAHGRPGGCAEFLLIAGGGLRWAEASDIRVPDGDRKGNVGEFWWEVSGWLAQRSKVLSRFCADALPGQNLLVNGVPAPDDAAAEMLREHLGTSYVFYPGDGVAPAFRPAYGLALMELGFGVPVDVSFQPSMRAVRKLWLQNAVLMAGALGFAYSAFLTHLAVRQRRIGTMEALAGEAEALIQRRAPETAGMGRKHDLIAAFPPVRADRSPLNQLARVWDMFPEGASLRRFESRADGTVELEFIGCSLSVLERSAQQRAPELKLLRKETVRHDGNVQGGIVTARWEEEGS